MNIDNLFEEFLVKHQIATEELTQNQLAAAFRQALACGDFQRMVAQTGDAQNVIYLPFAKEQALQRRIDDLEEALYDLTKSEK